MPSALTTPTGAHARMHVVCAWVCECAGVCVCMGVHGCPCVCARVCVCVCVCVCMGVCVHGCVHGCPSLSFCHLSHRYRYLALMREQPKLLFESEFGESYANPTNLSAAGAPAAKNLRRTAVRAYLLRMDCVHVVACTCVGASCGCVRVWVRPFVGRWCVCVCVRACVRVCVCVCLRLPVLS
jgi:hypothetical protein